MIHPNRSDVRDLTRGQYVDKEPAFSPDLRYVSFTSDRSGPPQIFTLDLVTLEPRQVTSRSEGADQSSFSRDGKLLAFHSGTSVYTINLDGTGERRVATAPTIANAYFSPEFSLDGTELVFDRNTEISAARLDGSSFRQIVRNTTTSVKAPAVSMQGSEIAYSVFCPDGGMAIALIPRTGGAPCIVGSPALDSRNPAWHP